MTTAGIAATLCLGSGRTFKALAQNQRAASRVSCETQ